MIAATGVSVVLGGRTVLDAVDLAVGRGEWVSIVGPNGAGKSTLLRWVAGVVAGPGGLHVEGRPGGVMRRGG
ncbi:MAG: ATP-binding cassette domain-containing protein, partial [Acidimicrobiia bacterium]